MVSQYKLGDLSSSGCRRPPKRRQSLPVPNRWKIQHHSQLPPPRHTTTLSRTRSPKLRGLPKLGRSATPKRPGENLAEHARPAGVVCVPCDALCFWCF